MKWLKKGLLAALILVLLSFSFRQTALVRRLLPSVSLRYTAPLTVEQLAAARSYARQTEGPSIAFWTERRVPARSALGNTMVQQITFDGEADLAYPAEYRFGRAPSALEPQTCAVSVGLAWALWGGQDATGLELTVEDTTCRVVGIFPGEEALLLRPDTADFTAAELQHIPEGEDGYRWAETFAMTSGLGQPDWILWSSGFSAWIQLLPWFCVTVPGLWLVLYGIGKLRRLPAFWRSAVCFGLAFFLALLLPALLEALPAWLIPTRWSDLNHWHRLGQTLQARLLDLLALYPSSRDVAAKTAAISVILAVSGVHLLSSLFRRTSG